MHRTQYDWLSQQQEGFLLEFRHAI